MEEPEESATHKMLSSPVDSNQEDEEDMPGEAHPLVGKSPSAYSSNWTRRKKFIAVALCLVQFIVFGAFALIVPYFPNVAVDKGVSKTVIGLIFSVSPLVGVFVAPLAGIMFHVLGPKIVLCGGLVMAGTCQILFGLGTLLPRGASFVAYCFLCRIFTAFGGVSCYTTVLAIVTQEFPTNYATVIGISEVFCGLGVAGAPVLGGLIYQSTGYLWPTFTVGLLMYATSVLLYVLFRNIKFGAHQAEPAFMSHCVKLLKIPEVVLGIETALMGSVTLAVLEPVYAIFGKKVLKMGPRTIGLLYTPVWGLYLISSGVAGFLTDKTGKHILLMLFGFVMNAIGFQALGPAPFLEGFLPVGTIWLTVVAEAVIGSGISFSFIPCMPYMMHSAREKGIDIDSSVGGVLSGMFSCVVFLGAFLGPTLAGAIADYVDIRWDFSTSDVGITLIPFDFQIIGFLLCAQAIFLVMFAVLCRLLRTKPNRCR